MHLAELGSDVVKIESPGTGDYLRDILGQIAPRHSPAHLQVNKNKRSLAIDLRSDGGLEVFWDLLSTADIFIDGFAEAAADRLGIGYQAQQQRKPDITYCQYTGFGRKRPLLGDSHSRADDECRGSSGCTRDSRRRIRADRREQGTDVGDLDRRRRNGCRSDPCRAASRCRTASPRPHRSGRISRRLCGRRSDLAERHVERGAVDFGLDEHELRRELQTIIGGQPQRHWVELAIREHLPIGPAHQGVSSLSDDPHIAERQILVEGNHPVAGPFTYIGEPVIVDHTPYADPTPAPTVGMNTREVLHGIGYASEQIDELMMRGVVSES